MHRALQQGNWPSEGEVAERCEPEKGAGLLCVPRPRPCPLPLPCPRLGAGTGQRGGWPCEAGAACSLLN